MTRSEEAVDRLNENFHGLLRDITLGLSPEGRQKLANASPDTDALAR